MRCKMDIRRETEKNLRLVETYRSEVNYVKAKCGIEPEQAKRIHDAYTKKFPTLACYFKQLRKYEK